MQIRIQRQKNGDPDPQPSLNLDNEFLKYRTEFIRNDTLTPRSSALFYIETYYIKWVTTSWTDGKNVHTYYIFFTDKIFQPLIKIQLSVLYLILGDPEVSANLYLLRIRIGKVT